MNSPRPTRSDVQSAAAFLEARCEGLAAKADFYSDDYRLPTSAEFLLQHLVAELLADLDNHTAGPLPDDAVRRWNCLADALGPWDDQPGFDGRRWVPILPRPDARGART
ncbi:hypothetical protein ACGF12_13875 [Kitasatospora sp. NPDC048296]|uniref:hypothetical protein n=1 Tax=Kitasatospora sp. NPDC048296 TaxID=3364048 RepID=UPI003720B63D